MNEGPMISGGWEFIKSAYAIVWIGLGGYSLSLWARYRNLRKKEKEREIP